MQTLSCIGMQAGVAKHTRVGRVRHAVHETAQLNTQCAAMQAWPEQRARGQHTRAIALHCIIGHPCRSVCAVHAGAH
ncbi:hypothetical protein XCR_2599 [Xanthomonas campestris pv. raphani 756C]|nr:hypothetical protein XCR_2599 [Xanthomonas campestris pv. raphani 756C]